MTDVLITLPVAALSLALVLRCLEAWGLAGRCSGVFGSPGEEAPPPCRELPLWGVFLAALGVRAALLAAGMIAVMLFSQGGISWEECFRQLCQRWDGNHYWNLVEQGYKGYQENGEHLFLVFFPGYVWAVRLLRLVIPHTLGAGVTLSCLSFAGACCYLYRLGQEYYDEKTVRDGLLYLCLFPFSFFFGTMMTESLFLFLTAGACWYARKGKWGRFALFGVGAALTRMTGVLVIAPALVELLSRERPLVRPLGLSLRRCWKRVLARLPLVFSPLLGTGGYLLLNYAVDGDPFAFVTHQKHWHQGFLWVSRVVEYLFQYFWGNRNGSFGWATWFPALVLFGGVLVLLCWVVRQREHPPSLLVYGFGLFLSTYCLSWLLSAGRYLACCFPLFFILARLTRDRPFWRTVLLAGEGVFLGIYLCAYISGAQVM